MANILTAITVIIKNLNSTSNLSAQSGSSNRANLAGDALEHFVKCAFADCFKDDGQTQKQKLKQTFSYLGNNSNPPDAMLKGGDAIEIKKLESAGTTQLQLNSSYPKKKLHSENPKIGEACRKCESWSVKDMLYVIGVVKNKQLKVLFFVYGDIYCDDKAVYERIETAIKDGLNTIEGIELAETNELGRVNKVDHLGITDLRIRGMWLIKSPLHHFEDLMGSEGQDFKLIALIPEDKYKQFGEQNINVFESFCKDNNVTIKNVVAQNPDNPAILINTKSIIFTK